ncbi:translation initiation inhibitor/endoribonuclease L-PSP [Komagataeibacter xylinus NBRC 13693]|uniref:Translation initiation inhibitor/endoribonuclease L-PSP n=1 Tax=Komagataeibacter xylinus NBRC 13693 TaxID=1234668 RepID=A0A0D6QB88_KOMXY|nr:MULTISPECIES: RidA family protein [Komagataeibacter]MBV0888587.1 RidA family protein [Komagataeibacter oboediens]MCK9821088.1 RidA family protein [Komagataeibacter oboediens]GAO00211.1 translation initiation inhibitor/endoribonuclease L-PSP [Komagataeibacter xylinus NBRC 13693]
MMPRALCPPGLSAPVGPYSHAVLAGEQIHVSGLLALAEDGSLVGANDAETQARHIFALLSRILEGVGSDLRHVVKLTFFLTDLQDRFALNQVRSEIFGEWRPASTLVQVAGLIGDGTLMEIEAIATLAESPVS